MAKSQVSMKVNGKLDRSAGRAAHPAHPLPARAAEPHRAAYRLRDQPLRRLHRRSRRQVGEVLHRVHGAGEWRRHPHHRGHGERRRHAACPAGRLPRNARAAMRLLHAGDDHARLAAPAGEPQPLGGGNPLRHCRQSLPLHRLSEHRQGHSIRRRKAQRRAVPGGRRMNDMTPTSAERAAKLEGMGCKRKRVEDIRFVQGKGNYVDDLKLPGMLYGDFTRSPHGHARVKKIDTTKAAAVPGVVAVLTAETLKTVNLAWMPTLAGDVQMVLADGKVLLSEPGSRLRHRRRPLRRGRRRRPGRGGIRSAAGQRRSAQGDGAGRAGDPRGHQGQDRRRARQAQALQSHLLLAGRRQGRDRRRLPEGRRHDQGDDRLSARASVPARDLPVRRLLRQDQGRTDAVGHVPGAARHPHRRLADLENPRAQDPRHRPRHRRRLRQQGRRLFRAISARSSPRS